MKTNTLKAFAGFVLVLMVLTIDGAEDLEVLNEAKFSFSKEETLEMFDGQISRFEEKLENVNKNEFSFLSEENLESGITEPGELKETVNSAENQEEPQ